MVGLYKEACSHGNRDGLGPGEDLAVCIARGRREACEVDAVGVTDVTAASVCSRAGSEILEFGIKWSCGCVGWIGFFFSQRKNLCIRVCVSVNSTAAPSTLSTRGFL